MKNVVLILLCGSVLSCVTSAKKFNEDLAGESCDQALKDLPHEQSASKVNRRVDLIAKNIAAYSAIGAGATTEVLWDVTAGTVVFVGVCVAPVLTVAALTSYQHNGTYYGNAAGGDLLALCGPEVMESAYRAINSPPITQNIASHVEKWKCPDLKTPNEALHKVASCYEKKGDKESLQKAITTMKNVEGSPQFFDCLSPEDQKVHTDYLEKLEAQLKEKEPPTQAAL